MSKANQYKIKDVLYSCGNFSGGIVSYAVGSWYMYFYIDRLGLSAKAYSIAMIVYGIWNAINDPLMGIISDKTVSRWGRRKPYMMFGAVPLGVALILIFAPPGFVMESQTSLFVYFVLSMCIFDTFFTMTMLNWSAVLPEMYLEEKNRSRVNVYSQILGVVGAMIGTVAVQPIVNVYGFKAMAIIFAVIGIVTMLMSASGVREGKIEEKPKALSVKESFKQTFSNKTFLICVTSVLLVELAKVISTSSMAFYSKYVLQNDLGVTIIMGVMFTASMVSAPLSAFLCGKIGAKYTYIFSVAVFSIGSLGFAIAPSIQMAALVAAVVGIGVSGLMIMPNILYAQIIDEDQVKTGLRREGTYYGMNALIMRLSVVFQGSISSAVLVYFGYSSTAGVQTTSAIWGIRILMGVIPVIFSAIAVIVLCFYPLKEEKLKEIREKVKKMNMAG